MAAERKITEGRKTAGRRQKSGRAQGGTQAAVLKAGRRPKSLKAESDTRGAILSAARHVFARRGFDGTSIREIAGTAGVNTAMIYYHFTDKAGLYRSVLAAAFTELQKIWDDDIFLSEATAREKLERYVEGFIRFEQGNEELRRIFSMDFTALGDNAKWVADQFFSGSYEKLVRIIKEGIKSGEIRKVDPTFVIMALIGTIAHTFMFRPMAEYVTGSKLDLSPSRFGSFLTGLFFDGISIDREHARRK